MADRRDILKIGLGVVAGVGASQAYTILNTSKAESASPASKAPATAASESAASESAAPATAASCPMPAGIVYTAENPGKWSKKVNGHLPQVKVEGKTVTITTDHTMGEAHYIVRHTLVSEDGTVLGEKVFSPADDDAVSTVELPEGHSGKLYATSFCNKHDLWVAEFTV